MQLSYGYTLVCCPATKLPERERCANGGNRYRPCSCGRATPRQRSQSCPRFFDCVRVLTSLRMTEKRIVASHRFLATLGMTGAGVGEGTRPSPLVPLPWTRARGNRGGSGP